MNAIQKQTEKNVATAATIKKKMADWIQNEKIIHRCFTC